MTQGLVPVVTAEDLWKKEWRRYQHSEPITKLFPLQTSINGSNKLISISKDASVKVYRHGDIYPLQTLPSTSKTPVWPSDAALVNIGGHQRLVVSSYDRSIAFYNVLLAENDPERPEEHSCLGLGGILKIPAPCQAATALGFLPLHNKNNNNTGQDHLLAFGDDTGKVQLLKESTHVPTMGLTATLDIKTDIEVLHSHHTASVTQLLHVPHVGLLSSSLDGTIGIFDAERDRIAGSTGDLHNGTAVRCMTYHHPLTLAISGGAGRSALLWHPRGDPGKAVGELPGHVNGVLSICSGSSTYCTTAEHVVVTLSGVGTVTLFDLRTLRPLQKMETTEDYLSHEDSKPTALAFDQEGQRIITATKRPCSWSFSTRKKDNKSPQLVQEMSQSQIAPTKGTTIGTASTSRAETEISIDEENERASSSPSVDAKSTEKEEAVWRQAYSHLRLATIPDGSSGSQHPTKG